MSEDERIQEEKEVIVREEISQIEPDEGYDAMRSVTVIISPEYEPESLNLQNKNVTISTNTTTTVTPDVGYQGLGEVQITTNVPANVTNTLGTGMVTITENGTRTITPQSLEAPFDGFSQIGITTNVPIPRIEPAKTLFLTPDLNGFRVTEDPSQGYSGIESVTINVGGIGGHLVSDTITPVSSGGVLTLPSLNPATQMYGYAPGCSLNIPSSLKVVDKYRVYYRDTPQATSGGSSVLITGNYFTQVTGSVLAVQQQYGYIIVYKKGNFYYFSFVTPNSNKNLTLEGNPDEFYYCDLGPAKYVWSFNQLDSSELQLFKTVCTDPKYPPLDHVITNVVSTTLIGCSLTDSTP